MIRINLLNPRASAAPAAPPAPRSLPTAVVVAVLSLPALVLATWHYRLHDERAALDVEIRASAAIEAEVAGEAARVEALDARRAVLEARLALVENVERQRSATLDLLTAAGENAPDGVSLARLTRTRAAGLPSSGVEHEFPDAFELEIEGRADSIAAITNFADALDASGVVGGTVEVVEATADSAAGAAVVHFTLQARHGGE